MTMLPTGILFMLGMTGIILLSPAHLPIKKSEQNSRGIAKARSFTELYPLICSVCGITIATAILQMRAPGVSLALGGVGGYIFSQTTKQSFQRSAEKRRNRELDFALSLLLEQVHLKIMNGQSLKTALLTVEDIENRDVRLLLGMLRSGLDLSQASAFWINDFDSPTKRRLIDIVTSNATASETLVLVTSLSEHLRNEQRYALIGEVERRNQLVWIPVTIAVLLPGMIFIAIPLEATLKALLG